MHRASDAARLTMMSEVAKGYYVYMCKGMAPDFSDGGWGFAYVLLAQSLWEQFDTTMKAAACGGEMMQNNRFGHDVCAHTALPTDIAYLFELGKLRRC